MNYVNDPYNSTRGGASESTANIVRIRQRRETLRHHGQPRQATSNTEVILPALANDLLEYHQKIDPIAEVLRSDCRTILGLLDGFIKEVSSVSLDIKLSQTYLDQSISAHAIEQIQTLYKSFMACFGDSHFLRHVKAGDLDIFSHYHKNFETYTSELSSLMTEFASLSNDFNTIDCLEITTEMTITLKKIYRQTLGVWHHVQFLMHMGVNQSVSSASKLRKETSSRDIEGEQLAHFQQSLRETDFHHQQNELLKDMSVNNIHHVTDYI